ncbi:MAG: glycosyltransferase [Sulfuritalea sp.]|nr:glycosyltransferase [Sulfuritalea sp.]
MMPINQPNRADSDLPTRAGPWPLVSVIIPAYNVAPYIGEAIASVLDQNYAHIEVIVVDDGSTDGTLAVVGAYGGQVQVLQQANAGAAAARNRGLVAARGEFIAFLDADDIWLPGKLTAQVGYLLAHPEIGMVTSNFLLWKPGPDGNFGPPPTPSTTPDDDPIVKEHSGWIYGELLCDCVVCTITVMLRKSVIETVGLFNEQLRTGEDYEYWLRISRVTQVTKLNRDLACYRIHSQSTTFTPRDINNEHRVLLSMLAKYGPVGPDGNRVADERLADRLYRICFSHGLIHYARGDVGIARKAFREAISHVRSRPKAWIYWVLSLLRRCGIHLKR